VLHSGGVPTWCLTVFHCLCLFIFYSYYIYLLYTRKTLHNIRKWVLTHFSQKFSGQMQRWCIFRVSDVIIFFNTTRRWYRGRKTVKNWPGASPISSTFETTVFAFFLSCIVSLFDRQHNQKFLPTLRPLEQFLINIFNSNYSFHLWWRHQEWIKCACRRF
jgi:hypothetical protein